MSPPGHAPNIDSVDEYGKQTRIKLRNEPKPQVDHGWDFDKPGNKEDWGDGDDPGAWVIKEVSSHYGGDGAAGAQHRDRAVKHSDGLNQPGGNPSQQIENQVAQRTHAVFDIIAENI